MPTPLEIDYPSSGETVTSPTYTFRLGAGEPLVEAEVSIDRGPWQRCRHACGMWWYDWSDYEAGSHQLAARGVTRSGDAVHSTLRRFDVSLGRR